MRAYCWLIFCVLSFTVFGQQDRIWMHPNKGQWHKNILYKVELQSGEMYLENNGFTFAFHNASEVYSKHHHSGSSETTELQGYAVKAKFQGANLNSRKIEENQSTFYRNYFLGNDSTKWKSGVYSAGLVRYESFYPSIDLEVTSQDNHLKYSFNVAPNQSPELIQYTLEGATQIFLDEEGNLHTKHAFGEIIESAPKAWTIAASGKKTPVKIVFVLHENQVSFRFPSGYNQDETLIIDPQLTFSTFTGSTADNWGFTAAPDANARVFAAGIVFGSGYPITSGAYDPSFNGGTFDIGVSKFNATGSTLLYSSYIGGSGLETPNSMVCNANNELYIMGITSSPNFPMPGSPYDPTYNSGTSFTVDGLTFVGSDIYVARLNATGTALLSSTYMGGSGNDGINLGTLNYNYGDQFRGDIEIDAQGNIFVASNTESSNFPTNGFQNTLNGVQDGVIFKMTPNLNALIWSSLFGGSGLETANSLQIATNGDVYVTGGTTSSNLGFTTGHIQNGIGGLSDGYLIRINGTIPTVMSGTFMGTPEYDQSYFVQLDLNSQVYVYGQTEGIMPISAGVYGTPNSGQFIRKYNTSLTSLSWNTTIGSGSGHVEISPTAFLVSNCFEIYISGWGGSVNSENSAAIYSSSSGFQVTSDAYQSATNGSNFYIAVLRQDAVSLKYATFMGGSTSSYNHVDGGTSRFDKSGRIYHAVCGACGGNDYGFTTTLGVWSQTNQSFNCNLACFKFELNHIEAIVGEPEPLICLPDPVVFNNSSANGNTFLWNFGDNTTSVQVNPTHMYSAPGTYNVFLIVSDSNECYSPDTTYFQINIGQFAGNVTIPTNPICPGSSYQFDASGGSTYLWSPASFLNSATIPNPIATINETTVFTVIISDSCGIDTISVTLPVFDVGSGISTDTIICIGNSVPLNASGGGTYSWTPTVGLDNPAIANPVATPSQSVTYNCHIVSPNGCILDQTVAIEVVLTPPNPVIPDSLFICQGGSKELTVSGADAFQWVASTAISPIIGPTVTLTPTQDEMFYCDFINACGALRDSVYAKIVFATISAGYDTIICFGESVPIQAFGGVEYGWSPSNTLSSDSGSVVFATPSQSTLYTVSGVDVNGCSDTADVLIQLFPKPFIQTCPDIFAFQGDVIQLSATSSTPGIFIWSPEDYLNCTQCAAPLTSPNQDIQYTVTYTDINGCSATDQVKIHYEAIIFVPNTFTPDGTAINELFNAVGGNISTFEMNIYDRWGELIHSMHTISDTWDGTYKGKPCQDGTYVWKIFYADFQGRQNQLVGHINILR